MANYYYLIAGLPDISFDDSKPAYTVDQFRDEVYQALSAADRKVMDILVLENECRSLISALSAISASDKQSQFCGMPLEDLIASAKAQEPCPAGIPRFVYAFIQEWVDDSWRPKAAFAEDRLWSLFYEYAMQCSNGLVRKWYEFNLDLNNIMTAITARKYDLDIQKVIVGSNDTANALRTSGARDWGLSQELEFFDDVARLTEEDDISQRERKADLIRWRWLEDNTFFNYFSIEKLFSYMVRLSMVQRWSSLDKEQGQQLFRQLIGDLKEQTEVPAEFKTN